MTFVTIILTIYIWGIVGVLLFFLFAIAQFYQRKAGRRSFYPAFIVSAVFLSSAAIRYLFLAPAIIGDLWGDTLRFIGGLILSAYGVFLLRLMMGRRS